MPTPGFVPSKGGDDCDCGVSVFFICSFDSKWVGVPETISLPRLFLEVVINEGGL